MSWCAFDVPVGELPRGDRPLLKWVVLPRGGTGGRSAHPILRTVTHHRGNLSFNSQVCAFIGGETFSLSPYDSLLYMYAYRKLMVFDSEGNFRRPGQYGHCQIGYITGNLIFFISSFNTFSFLLLSTLP